MENLPQVGKTNALSNPVTSNSVSTPQESKGVNNDKVIAPGMFRINPSKTSREEKHVHNTIRASARTKPITISQPHVTIKKDVNSDLNGLSSTGVDNTKTRRPQPRSNTKNDRVPSVSKSSRSQNKEAEVEEHHRNLLLCKGFCQRNPKEISAKGFKAKDGNLKFLINFIWKFMGTVCFGNDLVAAILGFGDLQWGNILITRVYFVEGLGDRSTNLYTINLHEMAYASPICLMARASSTKSWLWHQRLSHFNFDTMNDLARNDIVVGLPKFKYHKEHLCPSCEQGKTKRASHLPKPVPNSRQRLHLLHMDLCGPMRIASINGKRYVLVIVDDYSRYTWVHFLKSKDEAPEVIIKFLKRITAIATACFTQNRSIIHRRFNKTPYELINGKKPDISFLHVFGALCYPKNDHEDIRKLGVKGDIVFFIGLGLDLTYAPLTITTQQPSEGELDLLFEAMYDDYIGGQPSATARTVPPAQETQVRQTNQLRSDGDMCMYALSVSTMEPKNVKEAITDPAWIDLMKEELLQFKRMDVWVLVPAPDNISPLTLKWIFKNKHDEEQTVIKNKSRLVVRGYLQEEGIDFEESFAPSKYVLEILHKYGMESCDPVGTLMEIKDKQNLDQNETPVDATKYRSMIGALMYLTSSRPDIVHTTCLCAQYQAKPTEKHLKEEKSWLAGPQRNKTLWRCQPQKHNMSIAISCNPVQHSRTKHIDVRYHFIKEHVEKGTIELYFVKTDYQLADIFTKALLTDRFNYLVRCLGMRSLSSKELERLAKS
nr:Gag-Pol polyprotein [Tanacetum cinerariifolium]